MAKQSTTLFEEFLAGLSGTWALLRGDRSAPAAFDFSQRGLTGSFIALILATSVNALLPVLLGIKTAGPLWMAMVTVTLAYGAQMGFSALALRQMQRLDGFLPYVVGENWSTVVLILIGAILMLAGLPPEAAIVIIGIAGIIIKINIARLIVTLSPWQIAILLVAQLVGGAIGLLLIGLTVPMPPGSAEAAAAAAAAG